MDKSLWLDCKEKKTYDQLDKDIETEICIIGGGLTGITTGYYLSKENKKVVILEKNSIGEHTSGNTTGKITSSHGLFYKYLINSYGKEYARNYLESMEESIKNIKKIIDAEDIKCDFEIKNSYVFAQDEKNLKKIKDEVKSVNSIIDGKAEFVKKIDLLDNVIGAVKFNDQAQFNAYKYLQGLASVFEKNKGKIYENTKVNDINKEDNFYVVSTDKYKVKAKYVVIASHYPIINFPGFYFIKMYQETSYLIAVETNLKLYEEMYINCENPDISYRTAILNGKKVAIIGGLTHKTGEKVDLDYKYKELEKIAKKIYPDCKTIYKWNTQDCISLDKIPYIGDYSIYLPNVYVATGYKKWGMTSSNLAANIITDKILNRKNKYAEIFKSRRLKPIKNYKELTNMFKQTGKSFVIDRLKIEKGKIDDLKENEGKIIRYKGKKIGVYKDGEGKIYAVKPYCSHLGCELTWNNLDKTWDCPCHGSRFNFEGKNLYDPAINNLEIIDIK